MSKKENDKYLEEVREIIYMQAEDLEISVRNLLDFPETEKTKRDIQFHIKKIKDIL